MKNRNTTLTTILLTLACFGLSTALHAQTLKLAVGGVPMYNIDLPGSNIGNSIPLPNESGLEMGLCAMACEKTIDCCAWTYVRPNTIQGPDGHCWLKNSIPAKNSNNSCISGTIGEANVDRPGSDYDHKVNGMTCHVCQETCYKEAECKAWTFVKGGPNAGCWLKNSVPQPVPNNACISGYFRIVVLK